LVKEALPRRLRAAFFDGIDGVDKIDLDDGDTHPDHLKGCQFESGCAVAHTMISEKSSTLCDPLNQKVDRRSNSSNLRLLGE
jgi:hypothetical protein